MFDEIKKILGHNGTECRVKIKDNGQIWRYGDGFDLENRGADFWHLAGNVNDACWSFLD